MADGWLNYEPNSKLRPDEIDRNVLRVMEEYNADRIQNLLDSGKNMDQSFERKTLWFYETCKAEYSEFSIYPTYCAALGSLL